MQVALRKAGEPLRRGLISAGPVRPECVESRVVPSATDVLGHCGERARCPRPCASRTGSPGQRIVLLTVFRKTRMREAAEVERAQQAQKVCEAEHGRAEHTYERRKES